MNTQEKIKEILAKKFPPKHLAVEDLSSFHSGHPEAKLSGGGHYSVVIVAEVFKGKKSIERQRMIYKELEEIKQEIHALSIRAYSLEEDIPKAASEQPPTHD